MTTRSMKSLRPACGSIGLLSALILLPAIASAQFTGPAPTRKDSISPGPALTTDRELLRAPLPPFTLKPGDLFHVTVFGVKEFDQSKFRVTTTGDVSVPLIGVMHVQGLTLDETAHQIAQRLRQDGMLVDPQVTVVMDEQPTQLITITGEVKNPVVIPAQGEHRLMELIASAGGLQPTASSTITIERPGVALPIRVKLGPDPEETRNANILLYPGDTVIVSKIGVVYVVGAFRQQGAYALQNNAPLTLMQVVSLAGGAGFEGQKNQMRIIRSIGEDRSEIRVDLKNIFAGKDPDPVLQQNDIVFLPTNAMKAAVKGGATAIAVGLAESVLNVYR